MRAAIKKEKRPGYDNVKKQHESDHDDLSNQLDRRLGHWLAIRRHRPAKMRGHEKHKRSRHQS